MYGRHKVDHDADDAEACDCSCRKCVSQLLEGAGLQDVAAGAQAEIVEIAVKENAERGGEAGEEGEGVDGTGEALAEIELSRARHDEIEEHSDLHGFGTR